MAQKEQHEVLQLLKELARTLGRSPKASDLYSAKGLTKHRVDRVFGSFSAAMAAAGIDLARPLHLQAKPQSATTQKKVDGIVKKYQALCSKREQIQGFFRSTIDLKALFARAGNPPSIKLSAQPDTHAKFVDRKAFNSYLAFLRYWKPDVHLILGDFVDCEGLSHWPADNLEPRRIVPELKVARALLQEIVDATPQASARIYLEGNHENWITQALTKMPELFEGLAELDIEINLKTLLGLPKLGYELFPLNELVQIGKANFTHGIYTGGSHAKKHLDVFKCNIYYGHLHDGQEHQQTSVDGPMEAASLFCLCRLDAKFLKGKPNNWGHGHGAFEIFPDGTYTFYKLRIINGRMSYNGVVFE